MQVLSPTSGDSIPSSVAVSIQPALVASHSEFSSFEFSNITASIPIKDRTTSEVTQRVLLDNVSGTFQPGVTAIIGASGAGKTTLLNILCGRVSSTKMQIAGRLSHSGGQSLPSSFYRSGCGYVMQHDALFSTLTPAESIEYACRFKLPKSMRRKEKRKIADEIVQLLQLEKCKNTLIGNEMIQGLSGGEKKRTSIAVELVTQPKILFLDEPTTGLDSETALTVMSTLRQYAYTPFGAEAKLETGNDSDDSEPSTDQQATSADSNSEEKALNEGGVASMKSESKTSRKESAHRIIITTIHQPSSEIVSLFDHLLLMAAGQIVYHGPADPYNIFRFLENCGYPVADSKYNNPADMLSEALSDEKLVQKMLQQKKGKVIDEEAGNGKGLQEAKQEIKVKKSSTQLIPIPLETTAELLDLFDSSITPTKYDLPSISSSLLESDRIGIFHQFYLVLLRNFRSYFRQPVLFWGKLLTGIFFSVLLGLVFLQIGNNQSGIQDRFGLIYFMMVSAVFQAQFPVLLTFVEERAVFLREKSAQMYGMLPYFLGKTLMEAPIDFFVQAIAVAITYYMAGLSNTAEQFFFYVFIIFLMNQHGYSLGLMCAAATGDRQLITLVAPMLVNPFVLFTAYANPNPPNYYIWMKIISPFWWGMNSLSTSEFSGLNLTCSQSDLEQSPVEGVCPFTNGDDVLNYFNIDSSQKWLSALYLFLIMLVARTIAFFLLLRNARAAMPKQVASS